MAETRESMLRHFESVRAELLAAIEGLTDAQMTETTIDGWSVKDHLAHLAFWDDFRADEVERMSAGFASALRMNPEHDAALSEIGYATRRDLSLAQVLWELETSRERLNTALAAATPPALDPASYGEAGLLSRHDAEHAGWIRRWRGERGY